MTTTTDAQLDPGDPTGRGEHRRRSDAPQPPGAPAGTDAPDLEPGGVLGEVARACAQIITDRPVPATLATEQWARAQFVRAKAVEFARATGADPHLVGLAALIEGLDTALADEKAEQTPGQRTERSSSDALVRGVLGQAGVEGTDRVRVEQIVRDSRVRPLDEQVSPEAQALHDACTLYQIMPAEPVALAGRRMREHDLDLHGLARSRLVVLDALFEDDLFYSTAAVRRYGRWAAALHELWTCVAEAADDEVVADLLARLPGGGNPEVARRRMVENLGRDGWLDSPRVRRALETVPRHLFMPAGTSLDRAYGDRDAVVTKRGPDGRAMSSVSAPWLQARMIEQAGVTEGSRVVEIGSGGYNAALLAEVVGPAGRVISVDIDPEVVDRSRARLDETGYRGRVQVVLGDGADRVLPDGQQVDAVVVTAGAWDIAPAWIEQLVDGGMLVVPLRMRGVTRSIGFRRTGDRLESTSVQVCGFVPMQGADSHPEIHIGLHTDDCTDGRAGSIPDPGSRSETASSAEAGGGPGAAVTLRFDGETAPDPDALRGVFAGDPVTVWSGVTAGRRESNADLLLRVAAQWPGYCGMDVAHGAELIAPPARWFPHGVVDDGTLAYLVHRPATDPGQDSAGNGARAGAGDSVELGVCGRGEGAAGLAAGLAEQILDWSGTRDAAAPTFEFWPTGTTPPDTLDGAVTRHRLRTSHGTLCVTWPTAPDGAGGHGG